MKLLTIKGAVDVGKTIILILLYRLSIMSGSKRFMASALNAAVTNFSHWLWDSAGEPNNLVIRVYPQQAEIECMTCNNHFIFCRFPYSGCCSCALEFITRSTSRISDGQSWKNGWPTWLLLERMRAPWSCQWFLLQGRTITKARNIITAESSDLQERALEVQEKVCSWLDQGVSQIEHIRPKAKWPVFHSCSYREGNQLTNPLNRVQVHVKSLLGLEEIATPKDAQQQLKSHIFLPSRRSLREHQPQGFHGLINKGIRVVLGGEWNPQDLL